MYSGSPIESAVWWDGFSFPSASFQGPEHNAFDLDSRFLVALPLSEDLLLCAKYLFIAARDRSMGNLLFWLGLGAAQKGAGSKPLDRRNRALSFAVGTLLA